MPYTLAKWLIWLVLAALAGGVIGYLLRSLRRDASPVRSASPDPATVAAARANADELDQLRTEAAQRDAQYDRVVIERDRMKRELDQLRSDLDECRATSSSSASATATSSVPSAIHGFVDAGGSATTASTATPTRPAPPVLSDDDLTSGASVIGRPLRRDDLTVVEGVGPKIADLLALGGVTGWWSLANTGIGSLQAMLDAGGPTFRVHDPGTWPLQANLLAHGRWAEFRALTDRLDGGRA